MTAAPRARTGRRQAILDGTLRVIADGGVHAVTHRAVAAAAGVPLASTTYHFASKEELVAQTLDLVVARSVELAEQFSADPPGDVDGLVRRLTALSVAQLADQQAPLAAQFELMLEAGRRPDLRPLAERWDEAYAGCLGRLVAAAGLAPPAVPALTHLLEGALVAQLSLPRKDFAPALAAVLTPVATAFAGRPGRAGRRGASSKA